MSFDKDLRNVFNKKKNLLEFYEGDKNNLQNVNEIKLQILKKLRLIEASKENKPAKLKSLIRKKRLSNKLCLALKEKIHISKYTCNDVEKIYEDLYTEAQFIFNSWDTETVKSWFSYSDVTDIYYILQYSFVQFGLVECMDLVRLIDLSVKIWNEIILNRIKE